MEFAECRWLAHDKGGPVPAIDVTWNPLRWAVASPDTCTVTKNDVPDLSGACDPERPVAALWSRLAVALREPHPYEGLPMEWHVEDASGGKWHVVRIAGPDVRQPRVILGNPSIPSQILPWGPVTLTVCTPPSPWAVHICGGDEVAWQNLLIHVGSNGAWPLPGGVEVVASGRYLVVYGPGGRMLLWR
ncbi:hypothetical protein GCM10028783_42790 [Modestobacter muralis]